MSIYEIEDRLDELESQIKPRGVAITEDPKTEPNKEEAEVKRPAHRILYEKWFRNKLEASSVCSFSLVRLLYAAQLTSSKILMNCSLVRPASQ